MASCKDARGQYEVGVMYSKGMKKCLKGHITNKHSIGSLKKDSAEQGHHMAQNNLGIAYTKGHGVIQDYKQAFYWQERRQQNK